MKKLWRSVRNAALGIAVAVSLLGCGGGGSGGSVSAPVVTTTPAQSRVGLLYCYYGNDSKQLAEVVDHTNCAWTGPQWGPTGDGMNDTIGQLFAARQAGSRCAILDVPMAYSSEQAVRDYFTTLQGANALGDYICALYPVDEPDLVGLSAARVVEVNTMLRRVARDYPLVPNIAIFTIYTCTRGFPGVESTDWAGCDDYDSKAGVLTRYYPALKARLRPEQRLVLVPGAHQCDSIQAFYDYAQSDLQVIAIVAFLWPDGLYAKPGPGLRSLPCRADYTTHALLITQRSSS